MLVSSKANGGHSAKVINKEVRKHAIYVRNVPPTYVTEYKENYKWPPLVYLIPNKRSGTRSGFTGGENSPKSDPELKGILKTDSTEVKEKSGPPIFPTSKWKKLQAVTDRLLKTGYEKILISQAVKSIQNRKMTRTLRSVSNQLIHAIMLARAENNVNGTPPYPPYILKLFVLFTNTVCALQAK